MVINDDLNHWFGEEISIFSFVKSVDEVGANLIVLLYIRNVEELKRHRLLGSFQGCLLEHFFFYLILFAPDRGSDNTILDPTVFIYYTLKHLGLSVVMEAVIYLFQALSEIFYGT